MLVWAQLACAHIEFRIKGLGMCLIIIDHARRFKGKGYNTSRMALAVILPFINSMWTKGYGFKFSFDKQIC